MDQCSQYALAVDLGGTNLVVGLVRGDGVVLSKTRMPTLTQSGVAAVVGQLEQAIDRLLKTAGIPVSQIIGIGVGSAGLLDLEHGLVVTSCNLPGWQNVPLRKIIEDRFRIPAFLGHDAAMVTWGEKCFGAGRGVNNLVCATIGTGIGLGIVIEGKLYTRSTGDFGHMVMDKNGPLCNCGARGCLERFVSGPQIAAMARESIQSGRSSLMAELASQGREADARLVAEAAAQGDAAAQEIFNEVGEMLALGIINVIGLLNPERFILGGGVALAGPALFDPIRKTLARHPVFSQHSVRIVAAELGDDAGLLGVGEHVFRKQDSCPAPLDIES